MKGLRVLALPLSILFLNAAPAPADVLMFAATLSGSQEVPPNGSPATGTTSVALDTVANTVTVDLSFSGLVAAQTGCHIHAPAAPGFNAPIVVPLPLGQLVNHVAPISDANEAHMINNLSYLNVHSQTFPGGEIRGQLLPVPVSIDDTAWAAIKAMYR